MRFTVFKMPLKSFKKITKAALFKFIYVLLIAGQTIKVCSLILVVKYTYLPNN